MLGDAAVNQAFNSWDVKDTKAFLASVGEEVSSTDYVIDAVHAGAFRSGGHGNSLYVDKCAPPPALRLSCPFSTFFPSFFQYSVSFLPFFSLFFVVLDPRRKHRWRLDVHCDRTACAIEVLCLCRPLTAVFLCRSFRLPALTSETLSEFASKTFTADAITVVGTDVGHAELVALADEAFGGLATVDAAAPTAK